MGTNMSLFSHLNLDVCKNYNSEFKKSADLGLDVHIFGNSNKRV